MDELVLQYHTFRAQLEDATTPEQEQVAHERMANLVRRAERQEVLKRFLTAAGVGAER